VLVGAASIVGAGALLVATERRALETSARK